MLEIFPKKIKKKFLKKSFGLQRGKDGQEKGRGKGKDRKKKEKKN
jgi:hypothetical protein